MKGRKDGMKRGKGRRGRREMGKGGKELQMKSL